MHFLLNSFMERKTFSPLKTMLNEILHILSDAKNTIKSHFNKWGFSTQRTHFKPIWRKSAFAFFVLLAKMCDREKFSRFLHVHMKSSVFLAKKRMRWVRMRLPERKKSRAVEIVIHENVCHRDASRTAWKTTTYCETPKHVPFGRRREWKERKNRKCECRRNGGFWQQLDSGKLWLQ